MELTPGELRELLTDIAQETVKMLRDEWCSDSTKRVRGETIRADLESEKAIYEELSSRGFDFKMVTEESGLLGSGSYTFVVDPLDGSLNYEHCIPWCSVSIAVAPPGAKSLSDVVAGVVAPIGFGSPISFAKGVGCFEGNRKVERTEPGNSKMMFVYVETPQEAARIARLFDVIPHLKVRSLGSSALEIALTGMGRGFAFVDIRNKLRNVDIAAAIGIARECGAAVVNLKGEELNGSIDGVSVVGDVIVAPKNYINAIISTLSRP